MDEYGLRGHSWFEEMYTIRESWIPANFKDYHMSGLMKTTSRSETINAFLNVYTKYWNDLVYLLNTFDDAIESQRKVHYSLEVAIRTTIPRLLSPSKIEAQAANVYTKMIFYVQKEMNKAVWLCGVVDVLEVGKSLSIVIATILFAMVYYVATRLRYGEMDIEKQVMINQAVLMFDLIIGHVRNDKNSLAKFVDQMEQWGDEISIDVPILTSTEQKRNDIQELLCVFEPESVDILPPTRIRNKGCGTGKRIVGMSERASVNANKTKRLCRTCEKMAWHDSRNCSSKSDVNILPPTRIRNKGCGTGKRHVGMSERASVNAKKTKSRTCEKMACHDSRNCLSKSDGTK
ncbi:uncharacterized protein LOC112502991 [Cynara cardunculus var. scolymus]|uniref:uncharacterized protein LOC112502991 n=1 Tax=Cynara cardunculus var. scolymus TaxID=59895 RepID=UPI000D62C70B|nr:uncharacterized protein LOC112502991 [Cynara cardunculus var. scolymus]